MKNTGSRQSAKSCSRALPATTRRRAGVSLVETLVVMSVAGVMMGLAITTIHLLLGAEHEATKAVRYTASVARLARVFREDLDAARAVELPAAEPGKPALLVATTAGGRIRYELDAHVATRLETEGAGETNRDSFHFPPGSRLRLAREADQGLIRLTIEMPLGPPAATAKEAPPSSSSMRVLTIEAAPSRVRRLEAKSEHEKQT